MNDQYFYENDNGSYKNGGAPTQQETVIGENRDGLGDEWNPDRETWDEFNSRTQ